MAFWDYTLLGYIADQNKGSGVGGPSAAAQAWSDNWKASGDMANFLQGQARYHNRGNNHWKTVAERNELRWMANILKTPSVARLMGAGGRDAIFGQMADQFDASYRDAKMAGLGAIGLSGLSGSGARASLEARFASQRSRDVAAASSQADIQHGMFASNLLTQLMSGYFGRMVQREQIDRGGSGSSGLYQGLGSMAGMALGAALAPATGGMSLMAGPALGGAAGGAAGISASGQATWPNGMSW